MIIIVALYFILTLRFAILLSWGQKNFAADYVPVGRKLPWYAVSLSMTGSNIATGYFTGMFRWIVIISASIALFIVFGQVGWEQK